MIRTAIDAAPRSGPTEASAPRSASPAAARGCSTPASSCFGTAGFAATGVKDVCRAAGLTDRYFYESFRDGRALFLAVFDAVTDELFAAVAAAVADAEPDAEEQLRAAIGTFLRALADDPRSARVVFAEAAAAGPEAARTCARRCAASPSSSAATARAHLPQDAAASELARARAVAGRHARARRRRVAGRRARHADRAGRRPLPDPVPGALHGELPQTDRS